MTPASCTSPTCFPCRSVSVRAGSGYTLLELLMVIVVLGVASALIVPSLSSTDVLRVQAAVRSIVADLTFAQSDALARQRGRAVVFDVAANTYSIIEVRGPVLNPATDTIQTVRLGNAARFHDTRLVSADFGGTSTLVFDEMGGPVVAPGSTTPSNGGSVVVAGSGQTFVIAVEPYTGRVTVTRHSP